MNSLIFRLEVFGYLVNQPPKPSDFVKKIFLCPAPSLAKFYMKIYLKGYTLRGLCFQDLYKSFSQAVSRQARVNR